MLAAFVLAFGLLGSCAGERPTLGEAVPNTTTTISESPNATNTTTTPDTTDTTTTTSTGAAPTASTTVPADDGLGPEDLLGYIATPVGDPVVRTGPEDASEVIEVDAATRFGAPTTFAVIGNPTTGDDPWLEVLLPTRPNGATAYVPRASVTVTKTPFRVFVNLADRSLRVENDGEELMSTTTAIGTEENPTPVGASYVTELVDNNEPLGVYGPYAFGLALHSDTLSEFGGGDGQVGIHGTNQPTLIGERVSAGCVRMTNEDVESLVALQLPLGVPVFII